MKYRYTLRTTLEIDQNEVVVDIPFNVCSAEPPVRYYPDGSGYPGTSAYISEWDVRIVSVDCLLPKEMPTAEYERLTQEALGLVSSDLDEDGPVSAEMWRVAG